jgi:hypothetical protein
MQARKRIAFLINDISCLCGAMWTIWSESEHLVCARRTKIVQQSQPPSSLVRDTLTALQ